MAASLAAGVLCCGWAAPARGADYVLVAITPPETTVEDLATVAHMSVGVMSTGIGEVPAEQTYLDISQGNRIDDALYDQPLPPLPSFGARIPEWAQIVKRADGAPAQIVPGLLASSLLSHGVRSEAVPAAGSAALMVANRNGALGRGVGGYLSVFSSGVGIVRKQATNLRGDDLLIAFAEPASGAETVPIGITGSGFDGDLTSDSTRTDGYVLATDIAPTLLSRFDADVPTAMDGEPIRAEGVIDPGAVEDRAERMAAIPDRRAPLVILCLVAWIVAAAAVALLSPMHRRAALCWLALAFAYMPLMLLAGAAIRPSAFAEGLLVGFGAAALAAVTVRVTRGWWALAVACAITLLAYAIDVLAGSGLTKLSLLGPNPIFGVRFYGIGNELEALIAVMVPVAVGAGLTAAGERWPISRRAALGAFLVAGGVAAVVFAAGRFGADVGAAIVLPVGAAVAAASLPGARFGAFAHPGAQKPSKLLWARHRIAAILGVALMALAAVALIDLVSGGNAHLTRSVLDAGGTGDLADIAQRRLELSAHDFAQAAASPLFWLLIAGVALSATQWRRIDAWLRPSPMARAGVIGACAAVAVGVLVNDSGASFLVLGSLALGASLAFAWAQAGADR
jgi:hypothetical protein